MPIAAYVAAVQVEAARGNATEHTFRPALKALLEGLDTGIAATNEPRRIECGAPDYQVTRGALPVGHVEAKDLHVDLDKEGRSPQMARYLKALPNLILTNYLEFRWFVNGELRDTARLARRERGGKVVREPQGEMEARRLLAGFLAQQPPVVGKPRELALRLAEMARLTRGLIVETFKREGGRGELHEQFDAFRKALIPGLDAEEFADMYAQTLAYGLFAARVAQPGAAAFSRQSAAALLPKTNPFLRRLFYEIAGPDLDDRIAWAVDDIATLLDRADMSEILRDFGRRTRQEDPIVHFYETFLAAYDPKMRESRGVYYTPEPVVSFIVRSVDHVLRTRFGKPLGLADQDTLILDPATGTATFLFFVVEQIYETLRQSGLAGGWNSYVGDGPRSLLRRLFGFELLMAPYAVAHLKLGLQLQEKGYTFAGNERLGVYLTNALDEGVPAQTAFPFARYIAEEGQAAAEVKSSKPIMVVLGNPPYSNFGGMNKGDWIRELIEDYKKDLNERKINLDDDYIKFIRFGQWRIEQTGSGILAFISNNSYIDGITHRRMRKSLMDTFTDIYILDLHGSSKKQEKAPDGSKDENVFDIQQGVAIAIFVKEAGKQGLARVYHSELWGERADKYECLQAEDIATIQWRELSAEPNHYFFEPKDFSFQKEYNSSTSIDAAFSISQNGLKTDRDSLFFDFDRNILEQRIQTFYSAAGVEPPFNEEYNISDSSSYDLLSRRKKTTYSADYIQQCLYRPFDLRWLYYSPGLTSRPAWDVMQHMVAGRNMALIALRQTRRDETGTFLVGEGLVNKDAISLFDIGTLFPLYLYPSPNAKRAQASLFDANDSAGRGGRRANLSAAFIGELAGKLHLVWVGDGRGDGRATIGPEDVFHYAYAVFHSPTYRARYAELLKIDFPRLPLTGDAGLFFDLAAFGAELVDLHLLRAPGAVGRDAVGGNGGAAALASPRTRFVGGGANIVEKVSYDAANGRVHISATHYFEGVDAATWAFRVGGYQVLDKWLKDRKGHSLSFDDLLHYGRVVVALAETQRLMAAIDGRIGAWPITG